MTPLDRPYKRTIRRTLVVRHVTSFLPALAWALTLVSLGCGSHTDDGASKGGVWGPPARVEMLAKFYGTWRLNAKATGDLRVDPNGKAPVLTAVDGYRIQMDGHVITGMGILQEEHRLFLLHEHDGWVCGRSWHHEDRHDPGDVSKYHVKLKLDGDRLTMKLRGAIRSADLNDPDVSGEAPIVSANGATCPLSNDFDNGWGKWVSYVYDREPKE